VSIQKLIFPGLILGIIGLIVFTRFLTAHPGTGMTANAAGGSLQSNIATVNEEVSQAAEADTAACSLKQTYPEAILQWCQLIERYARDNGIDPNLVSAVMLQESAGRPDAYSKSGAVGLMQVMPRDGKAAGFMCKNGPCFSDRPSMNELFDPEYNVAYATGMLADLIAKHGDVRNALRAYGPMDVGYYYADLVIGIMNSYQ
jgi:soluble lytic murein transglycosylase-like protein